MKKQPSQIKRYRYYEDEVPVTLPLQFDGVSGTSDDSENFLIELVNREDTIIGLFFLLDWGEMGGVEINDWQEFATNYDEVNAGEPEWDFWQLSYLIDVDEEGNKAYDFEHSAEYLVSNSYFRDFSYILICGGRLRYPFGLSETYAKVYREVIDWKYAGETDRSLVWHRIFEDVDELMLHTNIPKRKNATVTKICSEVSDILEVAVTLLGFEKVTDSTLITALSKIDLLCYQDYSDVLLTRTSIDLFLDASISTEKTEVTAFLKHYKDKHFLIKGKTEAT